MQDLRIQAVVVLGTRSSKPIGDYLCSGSDERGIEMTTPYEYMAKVFPDEDPKEFIEEVRTHKWGLSKRLGWATEWRCQRCYSWLVILPPLPTIVLTAGKA
jgi:hypothetical protein